MSKTEQDIKYGVEEDIMVATAVATPNSQPPIPAGHSRFYCNKCRTPYDLPDKATSWRCANCMEFNSTTPGECEWCSILLMQKVQSDAIRKEKGADVRDAQ